MDTPSSDEVRLVSSSLIGSKFRLGGRGPHDFDCVGVLLHLYWDLLGIKLPDPAEPTSYTSAGVSKFAQRFRRIREREDLRPLDALHFRRRRQHLAVVEDLRYAIHATDSQIVRVPIRSVSWPSFDIYRLRELAGP